MLDESDEALDHPGMWGLCTYSIDTVSGMLTTLKNSVRSTALTSPYNNVTYLIIDVKNSRVYLGTAAQLLSLIYLFMAETTYYMFGTKASNKIFSLYVKTTLSYNDNVITQSEMYQSGALYGTFTSAFHYGPYDSYQESMSGFPYLTISSGDSILYEYFDFSKLMMPTYYDGLTHKNMRFSVDLNVDLNKYH